MINSTEEKKPDTALEFSIDLTIEKCKHIMAIGKRASSNSFWIPLRYVSVHADALRIEGVGNCSLNGGLFILQVTRLTKLYLVVESTSKGSGFVFYSFDLR